MACEMSCKMSANWYATTHVSQELYHFSLGRLISSYLAMKHLCLLKSEVAIQIVYAQVRDKVSQAAPVLL
jgi:hypothetical protein